MECAEFAEVVIELMRDQDIAVFDNPTSLSYAELEQGLAPLLAVFGFRTFEQDDADELGNTFIVYKENSDVAKAVLETLGWPHVR